MVTVLSSNRRQPAGEQGTGRGGGGVRNERLKEWYKTRRELREGVTLFRTTGMNLTDCALTNIAALAVLVTWQASIGCVVTTDHSSIVVDDCIQVVDRGLLHLILLANTKLTQIQVPGRQGYIRGFAIEVGENCTFRSFVFYHQKLVWCVLNIMISTLK